MRMKGRGGSPALFDYEWGDNMNKKSYKLKNVTIRLVDDPPFYSDKPMNSAEAAVEVMNDALKQYDREVVCAVNLRSNLMPINVNICSIGAIDQSVIHPREVLKSAILSNAAGVILMHNHPSGSLEPSKHDIAITDRLKKAFDVIGIRLIDHIIVAGNGLYYSFREQGRMKIGEQHYATEVAEIKL